LAEVIPSGPSPGGDFDPPIATHRGGLDYGRCVASLRDVLDHARAADAPADVVSQAADLLEQVSELMAPFDTDEWRSPSGRRPDLPTRGNILTVPHAVRPGDDGRLHGWAQFRRYHLGRNGAVHGGIIAHLFDSILGQTSYLLTGGHFQRTAYLHVNYRKIVPIGQELKIDAGVSRVEGRKIFVEMNLCHDGTVLADGDALFVRLNPGQP